MALGLRWLRRAGEETDEEAWKRVVEHATGSLRLGLSDDGGWRELVRQALDKLLRSSSSSLDLIEDAMAKTAEAWSLRIENTGGDGGWEILENLLCEGHLAAVRRADEELGAAARRVLNWRLERVGAGFDSGRFGERLRGMHSGYFGDDWGVEYQSLIEGRWRRFLRVDDGRLGLAQRRQLTWLARQMECWSERFECETAILPEEFVEQPWREFSASPTFVFFERLRECALILDQWPPWRERAFELLLQRANEIAFSPARKRSYLAPAGSAAYDSERVRIWLAEGEVEEAYRVAMSGDCADDLWLKLAALRIRTDPAGTLEIYKRLVRKSLGRKDRYSAKQSGKLLRKTCRLMKRLGREEEYGEFVDELSRTFGSQRNFACLFSRRQG